MSKILIKPSKQVEKTILRQTEFALTKEKQVVIHFTFKCQPGMAFRIWKTTYLITEKGKKIPLVFWSGISLYPEWTRLYHVGKYQFALIFNGLPNECRVFSLVEEINEPGGFLVNNLIRNEEDVYHIGL
tara:strand:- start:522 stop:908 length:387 start_codon:yes stop_codon:yes gene_type:complete